MGTFGGAATINSPSNCSFDNLPGQPINTTGNYSGTSQGAMIWVFVYPPNGPYYPQSPFACNGPSSPPPNQSGGTWNVPTYLGNIGDPPKWFDIVVVVADQSAGITIGEMLYEDCSNGLYDGISAGQLSAMNISEKASITLRTK
jgi:hypothetical protein